MNELLTIPEVRVSMRVAAWRVSEGGPPVTAKEIMTWVGHMHRRKPLTKAPPRSAHANRDLFKKIRAYRIAHPTVDVREIGEVFNCSVGRVSEAIRGKRGQKPVKS